MNAADEAELKRIECHQANYLAHMVTIGAYDLPWLIAKVRELDKRIAELEREEQPV